ncbi:sigma factor [Streptomyces sp. NPDC006733]|uniref:sigma factor n=1 Tax=Streptomyces sp. NPDC006733 TaxID=3155460 RepID=UPI003408F352
MTTLSSPPTEPGGEPSDPVLHAIMGERRQLINLVYRLLGSLAEAEDAVQETYTRWYSLTPQQRQAIESPGAWLTRVAGRICLNLLGSARVRRERYVGDWIPEPLPELSEWSGGRAAGMTVDPADRVTLDESVGMAFLVVLEAMTPAERVAFVLHDVFRFPFAEVADIVGRTPAACRQQATVVRHFKQAWEARDIGALIGLLDPNVTATGDGGGLASTVRRPLGSPEQLARGLVDLVGRLAGLTLLERTVNGRPGLVAQQAGAVVTVYAFDIAGDRITRIWAVRNPEKLRPWAAVSGGGGQVGR